MRFHFRKNGLLALKSIYTLIKELEESKALAFNHFKEHFREHHHSRPKLDGVDFRELFSEESSNLEKPFSMQYLK